MKTNQKLVVKFLYGDLRIESKTGLGDLADLFFIGNQYRSKDGLSAIDFRTWRNNPRTIEFAGLVEERTGNPAFVAGKGRKGRTKAQLLMLLDAAAYMSPRFKLEIYEHFIDGKILEWRNDSGDAFKNMNAALVLASSELIGGSPSIDHYKQLARSIRTKVLGANHPGWNAASASDLKRRTEIENDLTKFLERGFIKDWNQLIDVVRSY